jgi:two-component system, response regulator PdtaR
MTRIFYTLVFGTPYSIKHPMSLTSPKTIILVDDDKVQHMINRKILHKAFPDLNFHSFANPLEALSWLEENKADLLLLDINMPEMKGWEFLEIMERKGIQMEVKMLSSSMDAADMEKSKNYRLVTGFLVKPLNKSSAEALLNS